MRIGKIELIKERLAAAVFVVTIAVALAAYIIFYAPLLQKLGIEYLKCRSVENKVSECRNIIDSAGKIRGKRVLPTEREISLAIDELTGHGRSKGIDFVSIKPKEIIKEPKGLYKILPIEMEIKSTYREIGILLGSLDNLDKGVIKVKSFGITPDEKEKNKVRTNLVVDMYLSGRENAG